MCDNGSGCIREHEINKWALQPVFFKNIRRLEHNRGKKISECIIVLSKAKSRYNYGLCVYTSVYMYLYTRMY